MSRPIAAIATFKRDPLARNGNQRLPSQRRAGPYHPAALPPRYELADAGAVRTLPDPTRAVSRETRSLTAGRTGTMPDQPGFNVRYVVVP